MQQALQALQDTLALQVLRVQLVYKEQQVPLALQVYQVITDLRVQLEQLVQQAIKVVQVLQDI